MSEEEFAAHAEDFLYGFYGRGGKYIAQFLQYAASLGRKGKAYSSLSSHADIYGLKLREDGTYDDTFIRKGQSYFEKALACAETDAERARIKKASLVLDSFELYYCMDHVMRKGSAEKQAEMIGRNKKYYEDIVAAGIPRITENTFFPVVKNFRQSPVEWEYWDAQCLAGDRNNENYARELYLLLPVQAAKGSVVSGDYLCKTNNENECGYFSYWSGGGFAETGKNFSWESTREEWQSVSIKGAMVTDVYEFSERKGIPLDDIRIGLIPRQQKGILVKIEKMDAGAYLFIRKKEENL